MLHEELVYYNANKRGTRTGDCVNRSLSLALDIDYNILNKELNKAMNYAGKSSWKYPSVYRIVIKNHCPNVKGYVVTENITLDDFANTHSTGTFLIETGEWGGKSPNHIVCMIDGKYYDSWDSSGEKVHNYYVISDVTNSRNFTSLDDNIQDYYDYMWREFSAKLKQQFAKIDGDFELVMYSDKYPNTKFGEFRFEMYHIISPNFYLRWNGGATTPKWVEINVALTPSTKPDDVYKLIDKAIKSTMTKLFKRVMDSIKSDNASNVSMELWNKAGYNYKPMDKDGTYYWSTGEKSFYLQIIKKFPQLACFIRSIRLDHPGEYSDSVSVQMLALPDDPRFNSADARNTDPLTIRLRGSDNNITFEFYEKHEVLDMIKRYVTNWERPYDDYSPADEY